jgi:predicted thioesterase
MDYKTLFQPGEEREETFVVQETHTAYHIGSGDSRVLSTPAMISFMEQVSHRYLAEKLPENKLSVGIHVDVRHLAPTPVGATVWVRAELLAVEKNRFRFEVTARDQEEKIGAGTHQRAVIDSDWFQDQVSSKRD